MGPKDDRKNVAKTLREKHAKRIADAGGDLEVNARGHVLSAAVTWQDANIYDHIDIELDERIGLLRWRALRPVAEAVQLVEAQIQQWLRDGPPPRT